MISVELRRLDLIRSYIDVLLLLSPSCVTAALRGVNTGDGNGVDRGARTPVVGVAARVSLLAFLCEFSSDDFQFVAANFARGRPDSSTVGRRQTSYCPMPQ